ncbi:ATP-binding protein [Streptomyces sp. NPDC050535]|uniref:ATP-binding protein n=1 Tax=Streptomyces sp. NPDC050535 TaxID=3365626 RepID=UPI003795772B
MRTRHPRIDTRPPDHAVFDARPEAAADARDLAHAFMNSLDPPMDSLATSSVALVVSELVTNAVRHAYGATCSLRLTARAGTITIAVTDPDPRPPRERTPDLTGGTGGFGWPMVQNLADSVTVSTGPGGKTVRAELPR